METKAHYALVGFFAIALAVAGSLFVVWLGQFRFSQEYNVYDVVFEGPVRGLTESGEVRFNGIKVGEVTRLALDRTDPSRVVARIRIAAETPVMSDSEAQLEPQGLTGLNYIQISPGTAQAEPLIPTSGEPPRIQARQSSIDTLLESGESIAESATVAVARFNALVSDDNIEEFSRLLENVRRLSDALAGEDEDALIPRARATLAALERAATDVSAFATDTNTLMSTDVAAMVEETTAASMEVDKAAAEALAILEDAREPISLFANEGLDDLSLAIEDLRRLLNELELIASGVEDDPAGFVAGPRRNEVEVPR